MKMHKIAIAVAVSAALASPLAMAERPRAGQSFSADVTRTTGSGKSMSRHTEQVATENGFRRQSTMTTGEGKSASRSVEGNYDPQTHTYTKQYQYQHMNGETTSGERVTQRTENGYNRTLTHTSAEGQSASKQVNTTVDKDSNTLTKDITMTGYNGEVKTATVVKTYNKGGAE